MSTHNIFFYGDIRKIIPELSLDTQSEQVLCYLLETVIMYPQQNAEEFNKLHIKLHKRVQNNNKTEFA